MEQQTDEWLAAVSLKPGLVVCDNGRNLVAALGLAGLTHIPCLAHVLNLVCRGSLKLRYATAAAESAGRLCALLAFSPCCCSSVSAAV